MAQIQLIEATSVIEIEIVESSKVTNIEICSGQSASADQSYSKVSEVNVGGVRIGDVLEPTTSDALNMILSAPFIDLTYSYSINYSLVEKGLSVSPISTWSISVNDDTVNSVLIKRNNVTESNQGTSVSGSYSHADSISHTNSSSERTYKLDLDASDGGIKTSSKTVSFVAPTYSGVLDLINVDEANIKTLTKNIWSKANRAVSTSPVLQRYVHVYPKVFGTLSSIKDPSNFEAINTFDVSELSFTLLDGTSELMYVYVSNADTTQTNFVQNFIF